MSASPATTITSEDLRERVEDLQSRMIPDKLWKQAEDLARRKLDGYRERFPQLTYYDNVYLMLLTSDTINELELANYYNNRMTAGQNERS